MMTTKKQMYVQLWERLASGLDEGVPLHRLLRGVANAQDASLGDALRDVIASIENGNTFSTSIGAHPEHFSEAVVTMVRAGEAGGVLEVVAKRIAEGIESGIFPSPGGQMEEADDARRLWRGLAILLSSGVPILHALQISKGLVAGAALRDAIQLMSQSVMDGHTLSDGMVASPEQFPELVTGAIAEGEAQGRLAHAIEKVAGAIEKDDLEALRCFAAAPGAAPAEMGEIVRQVNVLLCDAIAARASDIHIDSAEGDTGYVRFRVDGILRPYEKMQSGSIRAVISRIKIMASLNIAEKRLPQDGRISVNISGKPIDIRVSVVPAVFGERVVMRILDRTQIRLTLELAVHNPEHREHIRTLCSLPNGIVLSNGPTGSGKTTLLYSMLNEIDRERKCVMTIEDPVEYTIDHVAQLPIRPALGLTFPRVLRSVLRQDPDVIMVGEIRDPETLGICVQAALTGHLVISTLHADTSVAAVQRLLDVGAERYLVNSSLSAIITQRLVRRLCDKCKRRIDAPNASMLPPGAERAIAAVGNASFHSAVGCEACAKTGYRGRLALHEILQMGDELRAVLLNPGADSRAIFEAARSAGMRTMLENGIAMAAEGVTSVEEVLRVAPSQPSDLE